MVCRTDKAIGWGLASLFIAMDFRSVSLSWFPDYPGIAIKEIPRNLEMIEIFK
jgi:hypothetical protein